MDRRTLIAMMGGSVLAAPFAAGYVEGRLAELVE